MALEVGISIYNDTLISRLKGELDSYTVKKVRMNLIELLERYNIKNIVFNLNELSFMDSTGIGFILGRYDSVKKKNGNVILCGINQNIEQIIRMSGLLRICKLRDTEASARWFLGV